MKEEQNQRYNKASAVFSLFTDEIAAQLNQLQFQQFKVAGIATPANEYGTPPFDQPVPFLIDLQTHPYHPEYGSRCFCVEGQILGYLGEDEPQLPIGTTGQAILSGELAKTLTATLSNGQTLKVGLLKNYAYADTSFSGTSAQLEVTFVTAKGRQKPVPALRYQEQILGEVRDSEAIALLQSQGLHRSGAKLRATLHRSVYATVAIAAVDPSTVEYSEVFLTEKALLLKSEGSLKLRETLWTKEDVPGAGELPEKSSLRLAVDRRKLTALEAYFRPYQVSYSLIQSSELVAKEYGLGYSVVRFEPKSLPPSLELALSEKFGTPLAWDDYQQRLSQIEVNPLDSALSQTPTALNSSEAVVKPQTFSDYLVTKYGGQIESFPSQYDCFCDAEFPSHLASYLQCFEQTYSRITGLTLEELQEIYGFDRPYYFNSEEFAGENNVKPARFVEWQFPDNDASKALAMAQELGIPYLNKNPCIIGFPLADLEEYVALSNQINQAVKPDNPYLLVPYLDNPKVEANRVKDRAMAAIATQFIGFSAQSAPHQLSSTRDYYQCWHRYGLANTGNYTADDVVMVSGSGPWRGVTQTQINATFEQYKPLLEKAIAAKAQFLIGNAAGTDRLVQQYLKERGYQFEATADSYYRGNSPQLNRSHESQDNTSSSSLTIYCDGACSGNPGPGGWGYAIVDSNDQCIKQTFGSQAHTTNQRMEIQAAFESIQAAKLLAPEAKLTVFSDSQYSVKTLTEGWKRKANHDLWSQIDSVCAQVNFQWIKGHSGDRWNEYADRLARQGVDQAKAMASNLSPSPSVESNGHQQVDPYLLQAQRTAIVAPIVRDYLTLAQTHHHQGNQYAATWDIQSQTLSLLDKTSATLKLVARQEMGQWQSQPIPLADPTQPNLTQADVEHFQALAPKIAEKLAQRQQQYRAIYESARDFIQASNGATTTNIDVQVAISILNQTNDPQKAKQILGESDTARHWKQSLSPGQYQQQLSAYLKQTFQAAQQLYRQSQSAIESSHKNSQIDLS